MKYLEQAIESFLDGLPAMIDKSVRLLILGFLFGVFRALVPSVEGQSGPTLQNATVAEFWATGGLALLLSVFAIGFIAARQKP